MAGRTNKEEKRGVGKRANARSPCFSANGRKKKDWKRTAVGLSWEDREQQPWNSATEEKQGSLGGIKRVGPSKCFQGDNARKTQKPKGEMGFTVAL